MTYQTLNDSQRDVERYLYTGARHELLHDRVATQATADIRHWIEARLRVEHRFSPAASIAHTEERQACESP